MQQLDLRVLIPRQDIAAKVQEMGEIISRDYGGQEVLLVVVLRGAALFAADLCRHIRADVVLDFIAVSSYGSSTSSSGVVRFLKDLDESVEGRHVLIIEDIVDTGLTLTYLMENLKSRHPLSLRTCTLLDKPSRRRVNIRPDYVGFTIDDLFVVGYGLDWNQRYRNLADICIHQEE
ncbi:MAG: Hypoxanthine phosphoribosyltransferase [Firmicutes bacterium]|nr:Hypoxanthine phosphoribosyltransferase [candidate division NPL-UPA2 bacterium]